MNLRQFLSKLDWKSYVLFAVLSIIATINGAYFHLKIVNKTIANAEKRFALFDKYNAQEQASREWYRLNEHVNYYNHKLQQFPYKELNAYFKYSPRSVTTPTYLSQLDTLRYEY